MNTKKLSLFLLYYTLLVILWGAWVRISGSGDGCGDHWPLCHDQVVPVAASLPTWIEFSHRLMSGLYGLLVLALPVFAFREFPANHPMRRLSLAVVFFTVVEAGLGARLVLAGLVGDNASLTRAYTMVLHMVNSLILMGFVALSYYWAERQQQISTGERGAFVGWRWRSHLPLVLLFFAVAGTGALAALSGTLFPSESLLAGLRADFAAGSHFLLRLRVSHPLLASLIGAGFFAFGYLQMDSSHSRVRRSARRFTVAVVVAIVFGYATLFSLSPTWMKLTHLAMAHALWVLLLFLLMDIKIARAHTES